MSAKIFANYYFRKKMFKMKKNYYFVATALMPLQFGMPPEMNFDEFINLLKINLSPEDYAKAEVIRRYFDIENIRAFWKGEGLDPNGNFDELELEEALLSGDGFPEYVYDFIATYDSKEQRLNHFSSLLVSFFNNEIKQAEGLLRDFLEFERAYRLILIGFRAKKLGKDLATELQFENPEDDLVAQILAQKDAKSFVAPDGFQDLQVIFEVNQNDPMNLHLALSEYRYKKYEEMAGVELFTIDRILGYMARLIIAEKLKELDKNKGLEIAEKALKGIVA